MTDFKETACLCALNRIFGFKPKTGLALIGHLGCAEDVFRLTSREKEELMGPYCKEKDLISESVVNDAMRELEALAKKDTVFLGWSSRDYPEILKECEDAPIGLYIKSRTPPAELFRDCMQNVAVVGTRDITPYGHEWCGKIVRGLAAAKQKAPIISGLALGTDICAHLNALECGLPTIAVMATGPDDIYPARHRRYAEVIAQTPGCALITDYPPGTKALAIHFLRRNRIIAGLSKAVILIESKSHGGGMTTARLAFSYSRDVFALPGRADDVCSQGCNMLIKSGIAEPVVSVRETALSLGLGEIPRSAPTDVREMLRETYANESSKDSIDLMSSLITNIRKHKGMTPEELSAASGIDYSRTLHLIRRLEIDGFICVDLLQRCTINARKVLLTALFSKQLLTFAGYTL